MFLHFTQKPERLILGLMSGTSLDGLDLALCRFSGSGEYTRVQVEQHETRPYDEQFKNRIRRVFAQKTIAFEELVILNIVVAEYHAALVNHCLEAWGIKAAEIDALASHGQTVYHAPKRLHNRADDPNATLQIGDGDHLAVRTGILTLSDFRQKHLALGGEGAPLALYGDYFLFKHPHEDRVLVNLGGIANFTYLPADLSQTEPFATDTGPANTLIDYLCRTWFQQDYDVDGRLASQGRVLPELLECLKTDAFFHQAFPKTTGPEQFSPEWLSAYLPLQPYPPIDLLTTLTCLTADTLAEAVSSLPPTRPVRRVYVSGGGVRNSFLMHRFREKLLPTGWSVSNFDELGIPSDAKEAVLFAVLANETLAGEYEPGRRLGGLPLGKMGKISLPY